MYNNKTCIKCKDDFVYRYDETWWDENGSTSTKLVKCPYCNCIQAVTYRDDNAFRLNFDKRYYIYNKVNKVKE